MSQAINKIILGTVQFGLDYGINNSSGKPGMDTVKSILDLAAENGIRLLDTAEGYGNSQEIIGSYHESSSHQFDVITKFSSPGTDLSVDIAKRILHNLQTLKTDSLYGYMFHSFRDLETYYGKYKDQIRGLKQEGLIKKFGVSIYTNEEFEKLLKYDEVDLVQLPFNLLDNNYQRSALILKAKEKGIEIHTRSVFLQGLFFKNDLPQKLSPLAPYLDEIRALAKKYKRSLNEIALNYAVQQKHIDRVLIGVELAGQLEANIRSLQNRIPEALVREIDALRVTETELLNPSTWNR